MVTKEVSKQSWIDLLEHDQLQIRLSVAKQRNIIGILLVKSALLRTAASKHCLKFDAHD